MKLLSFQPFTLYKNGGGSRVLRRLYDGRENQVYSLAVEENYTINQKTKIQETIVYAEPLNRDWFRWRIYALAKWMRFNLFEKATKKNIIKAASLIPFDVVHVVNHGHFCTALCDLVVNKQKKLWVSFHDHYSTSSCFEDTQKLWNESDRRLVISKELGDEYVRVFGQKDFEVVTDGVYKSEISKPLETMPEIITIYFAGMLHTGYIPLFRVLADGLDILSKQQDIPFKLVLRGTQRLDFLENRSFLVDYRSNFVSDKEIKDELDGAVFLYLPIKFDVPEFYLYSLSTKMVSYLGSSGGIIYHGPDDSAACNLLTKTNSAVCCTSLNAQQMAADLLSLVNSLPKVSVNAKRLARNEFSLENTQSSFWNNH